MGSFYPESEFSMLVERAKNPTDEALKSAVSLLWRLVGMNPSRLIFTGDLALYIRGFEPIPHVIEVVRTKAFGGQRLSYALMRGEG